MTREEDRREEERTERIRLQEREGIGTREERRERGEKAR